MTDKQQIVMSNERVYRWHFAIETSKYFLLVAKLGLLNHVYVLVNALIPSKVRESMATDFL